MTTIRRILVPIDFSDCSMAALEHAATWSKKLGATIDLLHIWQIPVFAPPGSVMEVSAEAQLLEIVRDESERQLRAFVERATARGIAVQSARCELGVPALRIAEESSRYDLIVIGTHGRTGLPHFMLGSVAERVVRLAKCSVLTVRASSRGEGGAEPGA